LGDPIFHVDAFTERPFAGNPAAVCLLSAPRGDAWRQGIAAEMNLAETAFLERAGSDWNLRWFTPTVEVDLCGHATLASAHVLWEENLADPDSAIAFHSRSGLLSASRSGGLIELDFPAEPATAGPAPAELLAALSIKEARSTGRNRLDYLIEVEDEAIVRALVPDFRAIAAACGSGRGVIVTAASAVPEHDFVSRYFAPAAGIDEDPVTGSTHCCLGPFWGEKLGKRELSGYQASARGGTVRVRLAGDRVFLGGRAITVSRGKLSF
jgi:PhzF family phenazine biosynthesis protein